jgi:hypothetical protein
MPNNTFYRDAPVSGRSPLKVNAFRNTKKKLASRPRLWCELCGRALVYMKDAESFICMECGYSPPEYVKKGPAAPDNSGIPSVDGLVDDKQQTRPKPFFKPIRDPREKILRSQQKPEYDQETADYIRETGATLVSHSEHIPQSDGEVLSREELREREKR